MTHTVISRNYLLTVILSTVCGPAAGTPGIQLTWDMRGWGLYKNKSYKEAEKSFLKAISFNKDGLGALSGLMWCYIFANNTDLATQYAVAKADVRNASHKKAKSFVANKIKTLFH